MDREILKQKWELLNKEYDLIILDILNDPNKEFDINKIKKMQKELFDLEKNILDQVN